MADQLWFMTRIQEEEDEVIRIAQQRIIDYDQIWIKNLQTLEGQKV